MAGKESWTDPKVKAVFANWADLLPLHQEGSLGRTWQDAAGALLNKKAGMYLLGMFVGQQFPEGPDRDDLDFFPFPADRVGVRQDTVEAPIDGFMLSKSTENVDGGKALLEYLGGAEAQNIYLASDPNNVGTNNGTDTSKYNALQKKAAELVGQAQAHHAVPRPRHPSGLRLDGHDPVDPEVHRQARRHRRDPRERRAAEASDLLELICEL